MVERHGKVARVFLFSPPWTWKAGDQAGYSGAEFEDDV